MSLFAGHISLYFRLDDEEGQLPLHVFLKHAIESTSNGFYFVCRQIELDISYMKGIGNILTLALFCGR